MHLTRTLAVVGVTVALTAVALPAPRVLAARARPQSAPTERINLAERLAAGKLRVVNREATPTQGRADGIHLSEREGIGIAWIEGTDFAQGTIEVEIRGRNVPQQSFV